MVGIDAVANDTPSKLKIADLFTELHWSIIIAKTIPPYHQPKINILIILIDSILEFLWSFKQLQIMQEGNLWPDTGKWK